MVRRTDASTGEVVEDNRPAPAAQPGTPPTMDLKIYSPFKVYYDDKAFSVSALNRTGPFDILPEHHNFITLVSPCTVVIRSPLGEQRLEVAGGLMHVKADKVILFLNI